MIKCRIAKSQIFKKVEKIVKIVKDLQNLVYIVLSTKVVNMTIAKPKLIH